MLFAAAWQVNAIRTFVLIYWSRKTNGGGRMSIDKNKIRLHVWESCRNEWEIKKNNWELERPKETDNRGCKLVPLISVA